MGRKSIGQRLLSAKSAEAKKQTVLGWADEWRQEYEGHVRNFEKAIKAEDYDLLCRTLGWLKADGKKRFEALPNVFDKIMAAEKDDNVD